MTPFINLDGIIRDLTNWLSGNSRDSIESNDVIIEYIGPTECSILLNFDIGHGRIWRDDRFILKIEEKKCAYFKEILDKKLPYIITIISTFNSGTTMERITDILTGSKLTTAKQNSRGNWMPTVSGILVIEPLANWNAEYFDNSDSALFKLNNQIMNSVVEIARKIKY